VNINQLDKKQFDQTGLHKIKNCDNSERKADVIFVHGLNGNAITTWHPKGKYDNNCWPFWLGDETEFENISIWSYSYDASVVGRTMTIPEQADSLLDILLNKIGNGKNPLIFITHSLGGLIIKQLLQNIKDKDNQDVKLILNRTKGIVFLATPHQGSNRANWFDLVSLYQSSSLLKYLKSRDLYDYLYKLNSWFIQNLDELEINVKVYFEIKSVPIFGQIVDKYSAKIEHKKVSNIPISIDHINIARPKRTNKNNGEVETDGVYNTMYESVKPFILKCLDHSNQNP